MESWFCYLLGKRDFAYTLYICSFKVIRRDYWLLSFFKIRNRPWRYKLVAPFYTTGTIYSVPSILKGILYGICGHMGFWKGWIWYWLHNLIVVLDLWASFRTITLAIVGSRREMKCVESQESFISNLRDSHRHLRRLLFEGTTKIASERARSYIYCTHGSWVRLIFY